MSKQPKSDGKCRVAIVGSIVSGSSGSGWYGERYTGSASIMREMGSSGDIDVYINSPGGSVFAGFEVMNALNAATAAGRVVTIYISAMAASIASYISSGVKGAKVIVSENVKLMFHAPWTGVQGSKDQLRDTADLLEKMEDDIMRAVVSRGAKEDRTWLAAGRAKWLSAKEAIEAKLADAIGNPPQDLIEHVAKTGAALSGSDEWDRAKDADGKRMSAEDRFAAACSFEGYLRSLAQERFGEEAAVSDVKRSMFRVTKKDGTSALLKYHADSLNIVDIDWESAEFAPKQESDMNEKEKAEAAQKLKDEADAKAKADADAAQKIKDDAEAAQKLKDEADAKAKADADAAQKIKDDAEAKAKADADAKSKVLPAGMTEDMVAFAQKNYQIARDEHIAVIKAAKGCVFTDAELAKLDIDMLAKMAKLPEKPAAGAKGATDNSLTDPDPKAKGTGGTLPPPEN